MNTMSLIIQLLRRWCRHARVTFPMICRDGGGDYVVCLRCGREFAYDWKTMARGAERVRGAS
jgi:hypothetical protein